MSARRTGSFVSPQLRARVRVLAVPVALALGHLGLTPNAITIVGFLGTCVAAIAAAAGAWTLAGVLVIAFGIFDLFDGALARATGRTSVFGAFLDSTLDRTGENLVLAGVAYGAAQTAGPLSTTLVGLAALAMATASVVTYTRAKAEAVGLTGEIGIAPRPERLLVLAIGLIGAGFGGLGSIGLSAVGSIAFDTAGLSVSAGAAWLAAALGIIVLTCTITIVQRIVHVHRQSTQHAQ